MFSIWGETAIDGEIIPQIKHWWFVCKECWRQWEGRWIHAALSLYLRRIRGGIAWCDACKAPDTESFAYEVSVYVSLPKSCPLLLLFSESRQICLSSSPGEVHTLNLLSAFGGWVGSR
jgi:hypothetical protein